MAQHLNLDVEIRVTRLARWYLLAVLLYARITRHVPDARTICRHYARLCQYRIGRGRWRRLGGRK